MNHPVLAYVSAALLSGAAALLIAHAASAAYKVTEAVSITVTTDRREAKGSLGSTRSNSSATDGIGCSLSADAGTGYVTALCYATAGTKSAYCYTTSRVMVNAVSTIHDMSYVRFQWDSSAACTSIIVTNDTEYEPTVP